MFIVLIILWIIPVLGIAFLEMMQQDRAHGYIHGQAAFRGMFMGAFTISFILQWISQRWGGYIAVLLMWLLFIGRMKNR